MMRIGLGKIRMEMAVPYLPYLVCRCGLDFDRASADPSY